ncbi:MAG: hypothetical protein HY000_14885, partial [Planctomycetes bacterium]|nr:hypothetical protein [Planctomycetota bacterium]
MGGRRVVLVCQEEALVEECSRSLGDSFSVVVASSFEQAELHLLDRSAWALVVDLAMFQHSVGQALYKKFFQRAGLETRGVRLLTIGPEEAEQKAEPDTLTEPVAVCHLRRPITGEELAQVLRQLYAAEPVNNSLPAPPCRMLRGRTRTFVTFA